MFGINKPFTAFIGPPIPVAVEKLDFLEHTAFVATLQAEKTDFLEQIITISI